MNTLRRTELIACDCCGCDAMTTRCNVSEREIGFASFAYVLCGGCWDKRNELQAPADREFTHSAILTRARRVSVAWAAAVAEYLGVSTEGSHA